MDTLLQFVANLQELCKVFIIFRTLSLYYFCFALRKKEILKTLASAYAAM